MFYRTRRLIKHVGFALGYGMLVTLLILVGAYVYLLEQRPDLKVWHLAELDAEFTAEKSGSVSDLDAYRDLENHLVEQLQERVYDQIAPEDQRQLVRYHRGSWMDPESRPNNWNRTFELEVDEPVAGALLLHGLSDSPYSMRALAEILQKHGVWSVGLRLPGHGTAPSGLLAANWMDWAAAVRIGMRHLKQRLGDRPLYMFGYSNGAALAVEYSLSLLEGNIEPRVNALVLLSPAIGVSPIAALARWQARLGKIGDLKKLAWNSIEMELDPYKYNSFTVNAGDQIHRLTTEIDRRINNLLTAHGLQHFPRTIAFQSVVDATVPSRALLDRFYLRLEDNGHELVLFDVNRFTEAEPLLRHDPETLVESLLEDPALPFGMTLVTNADSSTEEVVARRKRELSSVIQDKPLDLRWPAEVFSLSHVAVPFPPNDPLYGTAHIPGDPQVTLGAVTIRGERNLLQIPDSYFLRLRHNPFFDYMIERIIGFLGLEAAGT